MADFTTIKLEVNKRSTATPNWDNATGAGREVRWLDVSTGGENVPSASWPFVTRPAATAQVSYAWVYTADAVGAGVYGGSASAADAQGSAPAIYATSQYLSFRWNWDNVGTFASAPILTAYPTTAHGSITRGDNSLLGGNTTDTGSTARSYMKVNAFGRVTSAGAPAAGPTNAPVVTDGTTGALSPSAGANWLTNFQSAQGDNDWVAFPSTPAAVTADTWYCQYALFTGPNMAAGTHTPVLSFRYTYT
jgi:hypothetical protein